MTDEATRRGRSSAAALVGTAVGAAANFAVLLVVTAAYGKTLFGVFSAVTALFQLSAVLFRLGAEVGGLYAVARLRAAGRPEDVRVVLVVALVPVVLVSGLVAVAGYFAARPIAEALTEPADTDVYVTMLRVVAIALPIATVGEVLLGVTRGFTSMKSTVIASNIGRQGGQLVTVAIAAALSTRADVLAFAWALPYVVVLVYPAWWLTVALRELGPTDARPPWGSFWRYTTPQAANAAVQGGLEKADVIMLGRFAGADDTAVYSLANRFVHVVVLARYALNSSAAADFAKGFEADGPEELDGLIARVATWTAVLCGPVLWLMAVFPNAVLGVVGAEYEPGADALTVLSVAMLVSLAIGPVGGLLLMSGDSRRALIVNTIALAVNLGLNLWLIPEYGPTGAAVAWAVSLLLGRLLAWDPLRRRHHISVSSRPLRTALLLTGGAFGAVGLAARALVGDEFAGLIVTAVVGAAVLLVVVGRRPSVLLVDELLAGLRHRRRAEVAT